MAAPTIDPRELDKYTRKALGVSMPRENASSAEEVASAEPGEDVTEVEAT